MHRVEPIEIAAVKEKRLRCMALAWSQKNLVRGNRSLPVPKRRCIVYSFYVILRLWNGRWSLPTSSGNGGMISTRTNKRMWSNFYRKAAQASGSLTAPGSCNSTHDHMRELRVQHQGEPYRVLYAFDPRRTAILLIGGNKTGDDRWYDTFVPIADRLYDEHIAAIHKEAEK